MSSYVLFLVAGGANILGAAMAAPQAVRLRRTSEVAGISPAWAGLSVALNAWWVAYATAVASWALVPVAAVSTVLYAVVARYLIRLGDAGPTARRMAVMAAAASAALVATLIGSGWVAVGIVLGALYGAQLTPAVVAAWRSTDTSGIATLTWQFAWGEAALFGVYGLSRGDVGLLTLAGCGLVASTAILVRVGMGPRLVPVAATC